MQGTTLPVRYSRARGDWVIVDICVCGHPRQDHGSQLVRLSQDRLLRVPNEGNCCVPGQRCSCPRFESAGYVTVDEYIAKYQGKTGAAMPVIEK